MMRVCFTDLFLARRALDLVRRNEHAERRAKRVRWTLLFGMFSLTVNSEHSEPRPVSTQHLIVGAAAFVDVTVAEPHSDIVDELRDLKALQLAIGAVRRDELVGAHRSRASPGAVRSAGYSMRGSFGETLFRLSGICPATAPATAR